MEQVKVFYDPIGNTLTIWFNDPSKEDIAEEIDDEIVLMKDKEGRVIGLEKIIYGQRSVDMRVQFETLVLAAEQHPLAHG